MNPTLLLLRFEGVLQSWGIKSRWDIRDTSEAPTKSGVIGVFGCALGYKRTSAVLSGLFDQLKIGVRVENTGKVVMDYHTVKGNLWTAEEKQRKDHTIVSKRFYLQDASFLVIVEGEQELIESIGKALQNPKWPIYLGRKSCVPTRPVYEEITNAYGSMEEAFKIIPWSWFGKETSPEGKPLRLQCFIENDEGVSIRRDNAPMFPSRMFRDRRESAFFVDLPAEG